MKRKNFFRLFFTLLLAGMTSTFSSLSAADNASDLFHQGNIAYQKGDYITAVQLYSGLLKSGKVSSEVYYNLGNAYYKTDSIAKAILSYERAKKLNPDDEDVAVNLKIASLRVVDKIEPLPKIFYKQWLHSLATAFSADNWGIFFLTMIWLAFTATVFYIFSNSIGVKKASFFLIFTFLFLSALSFVIARESHVISYVDKQGIVMASSAYIKSSPGEKGNDLFILHEGAKVEVLERMDGWQKIRTANGIVGWISDGQIEII